MEKIGKMMEFKSVGMMTFPRYGKNWKNDGVQVSWDDDIPKIWKKFGKMMEFKSVGMMTFPRYGKNWKNDGVQVSWDDDMAQDMEKSSRSSKPPNSSVHSPNPDLGAQNFRRAKPALISASARARSYQKTMSMDFSEDFFPSRKSWLSICFHHQKRKIV